MMHATRLSTLAWLSSLVMACVAGPSTAQCIDGWLNGYGKPGFGDVGMEGRAAVMWDPDGDGPETEWLVVAGEFSSLESAPVSNVAAYDGNRWRSLGSLGSVYALFNFNGELYAGGSFSKYLKRWDGTSWQPLAASPTLTVRALASYQGRLVAAGRFTFAGSMPANRIAIWDGTQWTALGDGLDGEVRALFEHNGRLYAGGLFMNAGGAPASRVAAWDGTNWTPLGAGITGTSSSTMVSGFTVHDGDLIAVGEFKTAGDVNTTGVAAWNGTSWHDVGGGIPTFLQTQQPYCAASIGGKLFVGGNLRWLNTMDVAVWDGSSWSAPTTQGFYNMSKTHQIFEYQGRPSVVGNVYSTSGSPSGIMTLDNAFWRPISRGSTGYIPCVVEFDGKLIAGGDLRAFDGKNVGYLATWDRNGWRTFPSTFNNTVQALFVDGEELIAGGAFTSIDGQPYQGVAKWNGSAWSALGQGLAGPDKQMYAFTKFNGQLHAGGSSLSVQGFIDAISRWDGSAWVRLGGGLSNTSSAARVHCMAEYNGRLIVGGLFNKAGATTVANIAAWDGSGWSKLGAGTTNYITCMAVWNGDLYVGGRFQTMDNQSIRGLARWNGSTWTSVGTPPHTAYVDAMRAEPDGLLVGTTTGKLLKWDGASWTTIGNASFSSTVGLIARYQDRLFVRGSFDTMQGRVSCGIAWWTSDPTPWIFRQPESCTAVPGQIATFSLEPADGYDADGPLTFQWRRNGLAILDGPQGASIGGGVVSGSNARNLRITSVAQSDFGSFDCIVANICASTTSVSVTLNGPCRADFDGSGFVDTDDFTAFVVAFEAGDQSADVDNSGFVDTDDFTFFVLAFEGGC
jgi:hypothetical protein